MPERTEGEREPGQAPPAVYPSIAEARRVALDRLDELDRWIGKARIHAVESTLYELETDFQVIQNLAGISAEQILRILRESGLLRDAALRPEDQRPDEVEAQRERDRHRHE